MNTNNLKRFAKEARIKLLDQVGRKLEFVLTHDTAELRGKQNEIEQLKRKIAEQGKEHVIEMVAYTWFNRFMALRFMDANGYTIPKVITPIDGMTNPEVLQNALGGNIEPELKLDRQRLNDLLDGKTAATDAHTEAYKMLLVASCNQWHAAMPFMFERISDYTELLLPDDLLSDYSIVADIRNGMSEEDCQQEELIGWLYQFYIADKKDEVFDGLKKNIKITAENIPAATQLFTPRWIVRYMVENTLGKLWLTLKPNSKLRQFMPYYIEAPEGNAPAPLPEGIKGVTDITFLDPCQGSGHVLVYAFDLFTKIYEEEGYNNNEIPALILEQNLFGIDIDERAAQLAAFALTMKARSYYPRFLRKPVQPHAVALENVNEDIIKQAVKLPLAVGGKLVYDYKDLTLYNLTQADNFGSLIQIDPEELKALQIQKGSIWQEQEQKLKQQAQYLSGKFHCVVTNPPYMGGKGMNALLKSFVEKTFPLSKSDLMACFMERCMAFNLFNGKSGIINQHNWMFLTSYENLRKLFFTNYQIDSLLHLGARTFPEIGGEVVQNAAFVLSNSIPIFKAVFIRLVDFDSSNLKEVKAIEAIKNKTVGLHFISNQNDFSKIKGDPAAYWLNSDLLSIFDNPSLNDVSPPRAGLTTGDNEKYIRYNFEVNYGKIGIKWVRHTKGGGYRKWFGNNNYLLNWENDGLDVRAQPNSVIRNSNYYFNAGFSWSDVGSNLPSFRFQTKDFLPNARGPMIYSNDLSLLGYLNSKITIEILKILNPTIVFNVGDIAKIPLINLSEEEKKTISSFVSELIEIYKRDENRNEISLEFVPYLKHDISKIEEVISETKNILFSDLKRSIYLEEQVNLFFIKKYSLESILSASITIDELHYQEDILNKSIFFDLLQLPDLENIYNLIELIIQLFSYSVGCFFGRYCLDKTGLLLANQGETLQDFLKKVPNPTFLPDEDNIIPVLEGEWFTDDIVGRFKVFLKAAFGEEHFEENLKYIEDTIGKDIRKYFVKDFYNDHIKRYKKRPIYWMFSSPKGHFKALIYMHRYQPDLCSKMLNDYLQAFISKLEAAKQTQTMLSLREDISAREKTIAIKEIDKYEAMLKDCREYEKTLFNIATQKISIDLDDGVKVNYQKFKEVLVLIKGLEKEEE